MAALGFPAIVETANAQSKFDWKRFKGEKVEVSLTKSPRGDVLQANEKEFEELTGMKVGSEQIPEQQHRQKVVIEFTSGRPSFDVLTISLHVQKRLVAKGKWMEDLRPFLADASLTAPDFDLSDFGKAGLDYSTQSDGRLDTFPLNIDYWVLYWNKELFQQKGVPYPKTMDEIVSAAAKIQDPAKGIYGFTSRGLKNANVPVWTSWLLGQGMETVDSNGKMQTDTPQAIWAAELYKKLNKDYAAPGTIGYNWNECQTTFSQGRAAMWLDGIGFAPPLEDPTKSRIVGKVGYGIVPPGPKAQHSAMFGDGIGIAAGSKKKGQAYFYCQWATNKLNQYRLLQTGSGAPPRNSPYQNPEILAKSKFGKEWFDCMLGSAKISRPGLPVIVPVTEFRDVFGVALTNMIGGADPASELRKATEQFKPILDKSETG
ncbi:MAG: extracellular solute-binding protein [Proteobacteria bacterium]|nr:extracellular solute-binding protein [Pseudomonadota bacterium]